jgi:hypothetical protein
MRILKMVLIGLAAITFVSCQKELSLENPNHLPPPPVQALVLILWATYWFAPSSIILL